MNIRRQRYLAALLALAGLACAAHAARACTGIRLQAKDGAVIHARTMEFGLNLDSSVIVIPRGLAFQGTTASAKPGLAWPSKYAAVGLNGEGQMLIVDGVNEKGLAGGIFYLPSYAEYQQITAGEESRSLAPWELLTWILTNFSTVDEVREALPEIKVGAVPFAKLDLVPPVHYIVHDAAGNSLVVEYIAGKLNLYDNPLGVITNAPDFPWHIKNLSNYVNLSATNVPPLTLDGLKITQFGQGSGLLGIPGDFTPPSRFVRAVMLGHAAQSAEDGPGAVREAFHVLDSFDIPRGDVRGAANDPVPYEYTQWTSASDTKNRTFYFHTYDNRRIRCVDLMQADLDAEQIVAIPRHDGQDFEDLTPSQNSN